MVVTADQTVLLVNGRVGNDSHHPPCGPRCLLCIGRAAARPVAARQADRRRRRGRARRLVRGQGLRRPRRHAGTAGARALSAADLRRRPFQGVPAAGRCRHRRARRFHAAGRADLHRRGLRRRRGVHASVRSAGRDRRRGAAPRADGARPADLDRRGPHQAPGEDRLASGQARRAGGGRSRHRARFPARPAGRADVGRRSGHQGAAGRDRRPHHRPAGEHAGTVARAAARPRGRREAGGAGLEPRSAGDQDASSRAFGRRPVGARPEAGGRARLPADAASSCRPGRHPAAGEIAGPAGP